MQGKKSDGSLVSRHFNASKQLEQCDSGFCATLTFPMVQDDTKYKVHTALQDTSTSKHLNEASSLSSTDIVETPADTSSPIFATNYPSIESPSSTGFQVSAFTNEKGDCYYTATKKVGSVVPTKHFQKHKIIMVLQS